MPPVSVRIMHPEAAADASRIETWVTDARAGLAERLARRFSAAGAADVAIVSGPPDALAFGERLRTLVRAERPAGLVVLGSGAIPLATDADLLDLVEAAGSDERVALANDRYSADVVAIARATEMLSDLPNLPSDNALPRWLAETAGYTVRDLRRRWRLAVDIDGPIDLVLTGLADGTVRDRVVDLVPVSSAIDALRVVVADRRAELVVAGRTSSASLAWLERSTASRTRAIVEERGLRTGLPGQRKPASVLGALLDHDGPGSLGDHLARLGEAAIIDTRVLLAHRLGVDESGWPAAGERFASDLLLPEGIADPWLRALTASARSAPIPILLGGHTLVGPGIRLVVGQRQRRSRSWT